LKPWAKELARENIQAGMKASLNGLLATYSNQLSAIVAIVKNYPASLGYPA